MKTELISIGDELLIGQTVNTNASWIGEQLATRGANVQNAVTIQDEREAIISALDLALTRSDVVIITGGLGPTKDDITKRVLAEYFDTELVINEEVLTRVRGFFESRGKEMLDINIQQAALPKSANILHNEVGTASGMWFEQDGKVIISLPGVPYEMKHLLSNEGFDKIFKKFGVQEMYSRTIQFQGIGESYLADKIADIEDDLRRNDIKLAYLPSTGVLRLRFNGDSSKKVKQLISDAIAELKLRLPKYLFGESGKSLSEVVGELLLDKKSTVGTVESCTGGAIAKEFVQVAGSSRYFQGSIVSYSNELKANIVGVEESSLEEFGAVSEEVVLQMAKNGRKKLNVDYCIATSGVAGPTGGTDEKPVGLVWIAIAGPNFSKAYRFQFGNHRGRNIQSTVLTGLNLLRCELMGL
ncbi:MAG: competence/damage-inducible protein A [Fluviicola sp.]|nr:competence/damage-inducible protein A [Fluviicola sp.]